MRKVFNYHRQRNRATSRKQHPYLRSGLSAAAVTWVFSTTIPAHASFLFTDYLDPWLNGLNTDYSSWNYTSSGNLGDYPFYAANGSPNYPTNSAPYGAWTTASAAGVANPGSGQWTSQNPSAFWDPRNPRITQNGAAAFVTSSGGIYSYQGPTSFSYRAQLRTTLER